MSSDSDILSHFTPLDELIQVIYQGSARFVILSAVDDASWTVHVGLTGEEGRWWRGRWTERDVRNTVGSKVSSILLESFVEKMTDTFVKGDIAIGDWSPSRNAQIELVLGPNAKTPIRVPLAELSPEEGTAYAIKVFAEIALQAQSRKCRLNPSPYDVPEAVSVPAPITATGSSSRPFHRRTPSPSPQPVTKSMHSSPHRTKHKGKDREIAKTTSPSNKPSAENKHKRKAAAELEEAEEEIEALKVALEKTKRKQDPSKLLPNNKVAAVPKPKGRSLANPTKKARKYQALEFESDGE